MLNFVVVILKIKLIKQENSCLKGKLVATLKMSKGRNYGGGCRRGLDRGP